MTDYTLFPALNATLNGASAVLITTGHALIRRNNMRMHRACMLAAVFTSSIFLVSYLYYHAHVGSVHFPGTGTARGRLFHAADFAHAAGGRRAAAGDHDAGFRAAGKI